MEHIPLQSDQPHLYGHLCQFPLYWKKKKNIYFFEGISVSRNKQSFFICQVLYFIWTFPWKNCSAKTFGTFLLNYQLLKNVIPSFMICIHWCKPRLVPFLKVYFLHTYFFLKFSWQSRSWSSQLAFLGQILEQGLFHAGLIFGGSCNPHCCTVL